MMDKHEAEPTLSLEVKHSTLDLESLYTQILENIGEDPNRQGLLKTPQRASNALEFLTSGYTQDLNEILNNAILMRILTKWLLLRI